MDSPRKTVLVVDDEEPFLLSLVDGLACYGSQFRVVTASSGEAALELVDRLAVDLVVTDLKMPGMDGLELIRRLRARLGGVPVMVMTAFRSSRAEADLAEFQPLTILDKPLDLGELAHAINEALTPGRIRTPGPAVVCLAALIFSLPAASLPNFFPAGGERSAGEPGVAEYWFEDLEWRLTSCSDPGV